MILNQLVKPRSIVVVGASNNIQKPGGKVFKNIIDGGFNETSQGKLYAMNPKEDEVQGIKCFKTPQELPAEIDLAILSIPSKFIPQTVQFLAEKNNTKAFIVLSAGFSEMGPKGEELTQKLIDVINEHNATLLGPNCMGLLTPTFHGTFAGPIPKLDPDGVDFVSGSGATAAFIMEAGIAMGLTFSSMFSVGNSAQNGVEEVLQYWDDTFSPQTSSKVKLLYMEKVERPDLFLKHASSLIAKGCKIAAIKAGASEAGNRAASSHTGALASSNDAVDSLFRKAGVVRCFGREELMLTGALFTHKPLNGKRIAIVTHAGGPGVMLADTLSKGGFSIPPLSGQAAKNLLTKLYPGSSVSNPIDFLATGTKEQLGHIIDAIENDFDDIDSIVVIFGTPGLSDVTPVYDLIHEKMKTCKKPIFPILPSIVTAQTAVSHFKSLGRVNFSDEVLFGAALCKIANTPLPVEVNPSIPSTDSAAIKEVMESNIDGWLSPSETGKLLDAAGIPRVKEEVVDTVELALSVVDTIGYPVVLKAVGPLHKTDIGGIALNILSDSHLKFEFVRLLTIEGVESILIQPMVTGEELFIGAKAEEGFGHVVLCGLGGIYIEMFKDITSSITPIGKTEAISMIGRLKSSKLFDGIRGLPPINKEKFAEIITRVSALLQATPEIAEIDLNPLLANKNSVVAVDARIRIKK
jgi:acyl-CoA synthetase (NDP forming)